MILTETKEVIHKSYDVVPIKGVCDICGKDILPVSESDSRFPPAYKGGPDVFYDYYRITTHHHDWGNDSIESYEDTDACCLECALKIIKEYWEKATKRKLWPTNELEMEHKYRLEKHDH